MSGLSCLILLDILSSEAEDVAFFSIGTLSFLLRK
jgi:hypothetical protein